MRDTHPIARTLLAASFLAAASAHAEPMPELDCVTNPHRDAEVSSAVAGLLERVLVDRGDVVGEGDVVAELESIVERATVQLARTRATMVGELEAQQIGLEFDQRREDRTRHLHRTRAISEQLKEDAERNAALARAGVKQAREQRAVAARELARAEAILERKTVRSPLDGVVTRRYLSPGEYVEDQAIVRIVQLDPLNVDLLAPVELAERVRIGLAADVVPEVGADGPVRGTITAIDPVADAASGTFGVRIEIPNPERRILAGLKCRVRLLLEPNVALGTGAASAGHAAPDASGEPALAAAFATRSPSAVGPESPERASLVSFGLDPTMRPRGRLFLDTRLYLERAPETREPDPGREPGHRVTAAGG